MSARQPSIDASPFHWQGQPSILGADKSYNTNSSAKIVAPLPMAGTRFPGKSISTETKAGQQEKRWKLIGASK